MLKPQSDFWLYMTALGLSIDCLAAFLLALDSTNKYSERAEKSLGELRNRILPDRGAYYHKMKKRKTLYPGKELNGALSTVRDEKILGAIDSIEDEDVAELKIDETKEGSYPGKEGVETRILRPIVAILKDGEEVVVDDFGRFRQRLHDQGRKRKKADQDIAPRLWACALLLGFLLQLIAFLVRSFG